VPDEVFHLKSEYKNTIIDIKTAIKISAAKPPVMKKIKSTIKAIRQIAS